MKARSLWMVLWLGVSVALLGACGDGEQLGEECQTNEDCQDNEICHPRANLCVRTCNIAADCRQEARRCEALGGTGPQADVQICKCQTDELCAGGDATGTSVICSEVFEICVTRCGSDADCPTNFTCEQATGQCRATAGQQCSYGECGPGLNCNLQTGVCEQAATCSPGQVEPGVCAYAQFCAAGGVCDFVPMPMCPNAQNAGVTFNPATDTGPIIYSVMKEVFEVQAFCPASAPKRVRVQVDAYRTTGAFPSTVEALRDALRYYLVNGQLATTGQKPALQNIVVTNDGRNITFDANFCVPENFTQFTGALQFPDGNVYCFVVTE